MEKARGWPTPLSHCHLVVGLDQVTLIATHWLAHSMRTREVQASRNRSSVPQLQRVSSQHTAHCRLNLIEAQYEPRTTRAVLPAKLEFGAPAMQRSASDPPFPSAPAPSRPWPHLRFGRGPLLPQISGGTADPRTKQTPVCHTVCKSVQSLPSCPNSPLQTASQRAPCPASPSLVLARSPSSRNPSQSQTLAGRNRQEMPSRALPRTSCICERRPRPLIPSTWQAGCPTRRASQDSFSGTRPE
mmetsp:Transcript_21135/g.56326  ORF Transcript_21135/g.56326 Transcript_21135/m.56326 type:complete len:243 (-) Transcript_21135:1949-2677(-)